LCVAKGFLQARGKAIAKVRRTQPAAYLKICALLVPREMKLEPSGGVKAMTDEQLDAALEALRALLAERAGEAANVLEELRRLWRSRLPMRSSRAQAQAELRTIHFMPRPVASRP
jgi:hypothetical protein